MPDLAMITRLGTLMVRHMGAFNAQTSDIPGDDARSSATAKDAQSFTESLEEMGPTFIKFGQLLSTRQDLLPPAYTDALSRLQDGVTQVDVEEIHQQVEASLGHPSGRCSRSSTTLPSRRHPWRRCTAP